MPALAVDIALIEKSHDECLAVVLATVGEWGRPARGLSRD
jgi:hypothetical protein